MLFCIIETKKFQDTPPGPQDNFGEGNTIFIHY